MCLLHWQKDCSWCPASKKSERSCDTSIYLLSEINVGSIWSGALLSGCQACVGSVIVRKLCAVILCFGCEDDGTFKVNRRHL